MAKKFKLVLQILRYLPQILYFNFHYLPFSQAIHLPILLYKPRFIKCKGHIQFDCPVKFGMFRFGYLTTSVYPNTGITWENHGGTVIFHGNGYIGNDSYISLGHKTIVEFGTDFRSSAGLKLISYRGVKFGIGTRLGWGVIILDTNFHPLYDLKNNKFKDASGKITIGNYNWLGTQCKVMHSTITPDRCIFGMNTLITRGCIKESNCVMGGNPVTVIARDVIRDYNHDKEEI